MLAGKDKGRTGEVAERHAEGRTRRGRGVNMVQRHSKPDAADPQGGINTKEAPIHLSNVAIVDPRRQADPRRLQASTKDGKKVRFAKRSGEVING